MNTAWDEKHLRADSEPKGPEVGTEDVADGNHYSGTGLISFKRGAGRSGMHRANNSHETGLYRTDNP